LLAKVVTDAKEHPGAPQIFVGAQNHEVSNVVVEDGKVYKKTLVTIHTAKNGDDVEMNMNLESDGTRRLIEYMPLLYSILRQEKVLVIDEIERSIHPIMIKTIMSKISEDPHAKGQLIFTTHESCLLDLSIFRPDEIWFTQKDVDQSTRMYPLSDFNIHKTANVENGYLNGRYGGIPFLSNLTDLKW
jgi:AAA15 family ATPase/GTPase